MIQPDLYGGFSHLTANAEASIFFRDGAIMDIIAVGVCRKFPQHSRNRNNRTRFPWMRKNIPGEFVGYEAPQNTGREKAVLHCKSFEGFSERLLVDPTG